MQARLLVSVSDVNSDNLDRCARFASELRERSVPLSLLVAPRRDTPLGWVRQRVDAGDALVMHGFDHDAGASGLGRFQMLRTAEFRGLPAHEAGLRLLAARTAFEAAGLHTDCFVPPRWLASRGTHTALRRNGFRLCAELTEVHDLGSGAGYSGRVLGFGRGERSEPWWCRAVVLGAARAARRGGLVRLALGADDLYREGPRTALLDAVEIALHHDARPVTYPDLAADVVLPAQRDAAHRAHARMLTHTTDDAHWPQTA